MGIELSPRIHDHGFQKKRDCSCLAFLDAFCCVPPLYLPINQPLACYANRPRAIFQRPIVPRKRQEEHNKGARKAHERKFCGPWHAPRNAGKREKGQHQGVRGPGNLGGPIQSWDPSRGHKRLSRMGYVHRVGGSLRLFLVGPEMAPLTVNDRAVSWLFWEKKRGPEDSRSSVAWDSPLLKEFHYNIKLENVSWVQPFKWLKLNFTRCVVHQTRSYNMVFVN